MAKRLTARYCRKIFVGDVHGCFDELMLLLNKIKHDPKRDELYFVGDLAVKGPKSNDVVEFVRTTEKTYSVMGNHDYALLTTAKEFNKDLNVPMFNYTKYVKKDPRQMTKHMNTAKEMSEANLQYLASLPLTLTPHSKLRIVHAGIVPFLEMSKQNEWDLMNIRNVIERPTPKHSDLVINNKPVAPRAAFEGTGYHDLGVPWAQLYDGPEHIFFGHDARRSLQIAPFATGLDTGCSYGESLTAAIIKCNEENGDLLHEGNESEYKVEEWEGESTRYLGDSGVIYRLIQQRAIKQYLTPYIES